jgi:cytochrome c556
MKNKIKLSAAVLALLMGASFAAHAQFAKVEDAVEYRQASLSVMGTHFGRIAAVVKGEKPYDKAALENDAAIVEMMSKLPWTAFPPNSIVGDSKAKPEIWTNGDKFKTDADNMQAAVAKLSVAAKSGDLNAIKAAFGDTGKTCKTCHQDFKKKD